MTSPIRNIAVAVALCAAFSLSACSPVGLAMSAASSVGIAAAQEGGVKQAVTDGMIKLKISDRWLKHDFDMWKALDLTVKEGRVLITGAVPNPDMRVEAVRIAWQINGVKQVLNEITVEDKANVAGMLKDSVISGSIKTKIMVDKFINSVNYNIDTANGNVYIMGVAQDQNELDRVLDHARKTSMVKNVISYVHMKTENVNTVAP